MPFLILMPRHPERGGGLVQTLRTEGRVVAVRSAGEPIALDTSVYLADTLGEMGLFLALADVVVMGGSFGPVIGHAGAGGHNPLEPARLGKPTVCGPDMANWPDVAADLERAGGLIRVERAEQLAPAIAPLLADPVKARAMGERARRAAQAADAGLDRLWSHLAPLLPAGRTPMKLNTPRWWYVREGAPSPVVRTLLKPLSWMWAGATARRMARTVPVDAGIPVISRGQPDRGRVGQDAGGARGAAPVAGQGFGGPRADAGLWRASGRAGAGGPRAACRRGRGRRAADAGRGGPGVGGPGPRRRARGRRRRPGRRLWSWTTGIRTPA